MSPPPKSAVEPRKQPRQKRSAATVDIVFEATIQVLLAEGAQRLTTTRVAERAGVSVGTLYQYFPNKQSLLYAVLDRHLRRIGDSVETAAKSMHGAPLATMVATVVDAFVSAKLARIDEAKALYAVANDFDTAPLIKSTTQRSQAAVAAMLRSTEQRFADPPLAAFMMSAAMVGASRAMLEGGAPAKMLRQLRGQLESLCLGYLEREAEAI